MRVETAMLAFIDERLEQMLRAPQMWGSLESVELQILQLLEISTFLHSPGADEPSWQKVQIDYERFIASRIPGASPTTLSSLLGEREGEVMALLGEFVAKQQAAHPPVEAANLDPTRTSTDRFSRGHRPRRSDQIGRRSVKLLAPASGRRT